MSRAATAGELTSFRTPGQWSKLYAAIFKPTTIYTARINQTFLTTDGILEITYDTGSGTLADVLPGMTLYVGTTAGAWDVGICRIRDKDATKFYIGETTDMNPADNHYLTVVNDFGLWARHVLITSGVPFMDGGVAYTDQHTNFDPVPIMGGHKILKLVGASISTQFDGSGSYCVSAAISTYAWSAPGASATSGMATATPTITYNATGWYTVYLTVTAANGKSFFGVRYVFVWNDANPPHKVKFGDFQQDDDSGGWQFDMTVYSNADTTNIRDRTLVIVFAEDYYGKLEASKTSIGPLVGSENIVVTGWIAKESIDVDPELKTVKFTGYGAHYWFQQIPAFPDGVEMTTAIPDAWTEIKQLTLNKGLFHFLHWRTTATRIMDVFVTDDTKYTKEVSSLATNLWEQLREMAWNQIYARSGVNSYGQLYIQVHPQLVPTGSRSWATVMALTKADWLRPLNFERSTVNEVSKLFFSGVTVNESGIGTPFFSLSPGHGYPHYGKPEIQDSLLLSSQAQANTLCGLYYSWKNNQFKEITFVLQANNRLIECFPRQKCTVNIATTDNLRGIAYNGGLIPRAVSRVYNEKNGYLHTEVTFEAETFEGLAVNGDVPGSGDVSSIPTPSFPEFPPLDILIPGLPAEEEGVTAAQALLHDVNAGILYSPNFNTDVDADVSWLAANGGLTPNQYNSINHWFVCPNGAFYVGHAGAVEPDDIGDYLFNAPFLARAPKVGGTFVIVEDEVSIAAKYPGFPTVNKFLSGFGFNPLVSESVTYIIGTATVTIDLVDANIYIGSGSTFTEGAAITNVSVNHPGRNISYGQNSWVYTGPAEALFNPSRRWTFNAAASAISSQAVTGGDISENSHIRAGTTGILFLIGDDAGFVRISLDNGATWNLTASNLLHGGEQMDVDPTGLYVMLRYDTGAKGKSSDGLASLNPLPNLPPGNWWFAWAGGTARWIAAGGSSVRATDDFGTTWYDRLGNLQSVVPVPNINMVLAIGYY